MVPAAGRVDGVQVFNDEGGNDVGAEPLRLSVVFEVLVAETTPVVTGVTCNGTTSVPCRKMGAY